MLAGYDTYDQTMENYSAAHSSSETIGLNTVDY